MLLLVVVYFYSLVLQSLVLSLFDEWQKQYVVAHAFSEMKMIAYKMNLFCE